MADRYGTSSYSPNASPSLPLESEDMSSFLHHLLHNNNPSSCMPTKTRHFTTTMTKTTTMTSPVMLSSLPETNNLPIGFFHDKVFQDDPRGSDHFDACFESDFRAKEGKLGVVDSSSSSFNFSDPGGYFGADVRNDGRENVFSRAIPAVDTEAITISEMRRNFHTENDSDSYGYDSEKGLEAAELLTNPVPPRSSSKRSRAAEIHNLSEKRRRSRINEKIKALQKLIPNSNKTDKASMLDEAIEYLKQLQLQVQMLSMRNGLSLHPLYMQGAGQPMQLMQTLDEGNGMLNTNTGPGPITANQEPSNQTAYDLSNNCTSSNQPFTALNFGFEPVTEARYRPFNLSSVSKGFSRGDALPELQLDVNHCGKNTSSSGVEKAG